MPATFPTEADRLPSVRQLPPRKVRAYLNARGWIDANVRVGNLSVFDRPGELDQVLVPTDPTRFDFPSLMGDAVEKLANFERRPPVAVIADLFNSKSDTQRYRIASPRAEAGTLPLPQALDLLAGAKQSLLAAAHSVIAPKRHHPRLSRSEAVKLVDASLMGQTGVGSFVVTVLCPLDAVGPEETSPSLFNNDQTSFVRRATMLLHRALSELSGAIRQDRIGRLVESEEPVVSANLCDALLKMRPVDDQGLLEFSTSWAPSAPIQNEYLRTSVALTADDFEAIADIYRQLRSDLPTVRQTFVAYVDELKGEETEDGRREGEVILTLYAEDELVRARATLGSADYQTAYAAHNPTAPLAIRGTLLRGPRTARLSDVEFIRPIDLGAIGSPDP